MPLRGALLLCAPAMIGLSTSLIQFASEQHSRLAFAAKLALLQRSVKINVPKKQQAKVGPARLSELLRSAFEYSSP
jgi:hypothetical protein